MIESLFTLLFVVVFGFITLAAFPLVVDWITGPVRISPSRRINKIVNGGHAPPDPAPDRCHLTEQIHAAARDAGLCVDCGKEKQYAGDDDSFCWCGDFLLAINQKVDWQINELRIKYYSKKDS